MARCLSSVLALILTLSLGACGGSSSGGGGGGGFTGTLDEAQPGTSSLQATARCIGLEWEIAEDLNANAVVLVEYKQTSSGTWLDAMDLRRVRREHMTASLQPASNTILHAGSIFNCAEDTDYDVRLTLTDPDGGGTTLNLNVTTWAEPDLATPVQTFYVIPGSGGGIGTSGDPFQGIAEAEAAAAPGVLYLLRNGTYNGRWDLSMSGTPAQPIKWAADAGHSPILDANGESRVLHIESVHDIIIEDLELRNAPYGVMLRYSQGITLRKLYMHGIERGIDGSFNNANSHIWISDCTVEGSVGWPRDGSDPDWRGIQVSGEIIAVCYNRVSGFFDGIDVNGNPPNRDIDIYMNDISECVDDGIELDGADQNCRAFENRLTNCMNVISFQPVRGGPAYAVRNMVYNYASEPYKLHNTASGAVLLHNTYVKDTLPFPLYPGSAVVYNVLALNNLYVSPAAGYGIEFTGTAIDVFMDYDVICGGPYGYYGKWGTGNRYSTVADFFAGTGMEQNGVEGPTADVFVSGVLPPVNSDTEYAISVNDLRPAAGEAMIDAGCVIDNINDGFAGGAPDAGCLEQGDPLPAYGPR